MCGLAAAFGRPGIDITVAPIRRALARMARRGPDGEGVWRDDGVVLGHRRLAIIDLDLRAAQPMRSHDGRYVIVYNGEIFNYRELRRELESKGEVFRTTSDTEVILALFAGHGEAMLPKLHGMFAFVIWDGITKRGFAARDPYGIKPLYYAQGSYGAIVASQVKALLGTGLVSRETDVHGQAGFWLLGSVPEPQTWFRDIRALPAGHHTWIERGSVVTPTCWWDIADAWRNAAPGELSESEVRERVRAALRESVARHLVADVPVGVFLSGGIDSGALAGLMVEVGACAPVGITLSYDEFAGRREDEVPLAAEVSSHYGIRHHIRRVTQQEFVTDLPRIIGAMDQPSIDGINMWYASKAAAEHGLKVIVSGTGGDELFQGYKSFRQLPRVVAARRVIGAIPGALLVLQEWASQRAHRIGDERWRHLPEWTRSIAGAWWLRRSLFGPGDLVGLMGADNARRALEGFDATTCVESMSGTLPMDARLALGQIESTTYLRNQLLRDSDWSSMDHGIELRTPLVDAWLLEQVKSCLPSFRRFPNKGLLAGAPSSALPEQVIRRRKTGFGIPVIQWAVARHAPSGGVGSREWAKMLVAQYEAALA